MFSSFLFTLAFALYPNIYLLCCADWLVLDSVAVSRVGCFAYKLTRDPRHPSAIAAAHAAQTAHAAALAASAHGRPGTAGSSRAAATAAAQAAAASERAATVLVDVALRDGNKVVTFRSPVSFYNEVQFLPFRFLCRLF